MLGHLVERWQAHVSNGLDPAEAASRAIEDFGSRTDLGREFSRTYHSPLWASTIGVLLPAIAPAEVRPAVIGWLRLIVGLTIVASGISLLALPALTPLRAVGNAGVLALGLTAMVLAFQALGRGQRWALPYAVGVTLLLLVEGLAEVVAPTRPGSVTIPLGSILAAGVLLTVWRNWDELQQFVAPSPRLGRGLGAMLAISLVAMGAVPRVLAAIPDPTQATAADLELLISMTCDRGEVSIEDGPTSVDAQRATVVIDMTWSHTDLLPYGLAGVVMDPDDADTSGLRALQPRPWLWSYTREPTIVDTTTGQTAGWWGSSSPSVTLLPTDVAGSLTFAIDPGAVRPSRTIRATWLLNNAGADPPSAWPRVEVFYAHLDRFLIAGTVACGERVLGEWVPLLPAENPSGWDGSVPLLRG